MTKRPKWMRAKKRKVKPVKSTEGRRRRFERERAEIIARREAEGPPQ